MDDSVSVFGSVPVAREWLNISNSKGAKRVENFCKTHMAARQALVFSHYSFP